MNYGTISGFKAYLDARGVSYAGKTDDQITQALVRASSYIDGAYRAAFPGYKTGRRTQVLEWPRTNATDGAGNSLPSDEVPVEIETATYEGGIRELASPGSLAPDVAAGGGGIKRHREKIGPLDEETEYFSNGSTTAAFATIRQALGGLIRVSSGYSGRAVRA